MKIHSTGIYWNIEKISFSIFWVWKLDKFSDSEAYGFNFPVNVRIFLEPLLTEAIAGEFQWTPNYA